MFISLTFAQDYYYSDNRKIIINRADHWIAVQVERQDQEAFEQVLSKSSTVKLKQVLNKERGIYWIEIAPGNILNNTLKQIQEEVTILRTIPAYFLVDGKGDTAKFIMSEEFHVKFHPHVLKTEINRMNESYNVEIISFNEYDEYLLRVKEDSDFNTLELSNVYYESDLTIWSLPNFLADIRLEQINDPLFANQWHLRNRGQGGGSHAIDIGALAAWDI